MKEGGGAVVASTCPLNPLLHCSTVFLNESKLNCDAETLILFCCSCGGKIGYEATLPDPKFKTAPEHQAPTKMFHFVSAETQQ